MQVFEELGLCEELIKAISEKGFETPTSIQEQAIPILIKGDLDFVGLAQTGTGKTAAFGLPLLQHIDVKDMSVQALVLAPTRELCLQIASDLVSYSIHLPQVRTLAVYGGTSIGLQIKELKRGVQVVLATPGRLIDLIERKAINLTTVRFVVLDEADEMLNMGFRDDIDFILDHASNRKSTWLFSATMPPEVRRISSRYMKDPVEISIGKQNTAAVNIEHEYYVTASHDRYEALKRLVDYHPDMYGIIFTRTKADAQEISEKLRREGYEIDALHGDLSQVQRDKVMASFRDRSLQLLIATDVAARGIDVDGITHVINYALPDEAEVYTHRSGRTARAGKSGICMSLIHMREFGKIREIERLVKAKFERKPVPSGEKVCEQQFLHFINKLHDTSVKHGDYEHYLEVLMDRFKDMTKEDLLIRMASLEFDRFLEYYRNARDLNISADRKQGRSSEPEHGNDSMQRVFINVGTKDGYYKASFLQFVLDTSGLNKEMLGKIDLKEYNTFFEVDAQAASQLIKSLDGQTVNGRRLRVNPADSRPGGSRERFGSKKQSFSREKRRFK